MMGLQGTSFHALIFLELILCNNIAGEFMMPPASNRNLHSNPSKKWFHFIRAFIRTLSSLDVQHQEHHSKLSETPGHLTNKAFFFLRTSQEKKCHTRLLMYEALDD